MFKDLSIHRELAAQGFAVIDAKLLAETEQLYTYISSHFELPTSDFYYSLLANTYEQNVELQRTIHQVLNGFYTTHFSNFRVLSASFLAKPANTLSELLLHQDWCYTDEKKHAVYNLWIPLSDVDKDNGTMFFLSGSHLWFGNLRSSTLPTARVSINNFDEVQITKVSLKRGQALLFHPAVFHGSYPNLSSAHRMVITASILAIDAPFLYYQGIDKSEVVEVFHLDDDAFLKGLEKIAVGGRPEAVVVDTLKYSHTIVTAEELRRKLAQAYDQ